MSKHKPFDVEWFTILVRKKKQSKVKVNNRKQKGAFYFHHPWPPMPDKHVIEENDGKQLPRSTIYKRESSRERMRSLLPEVMVVVGETR